MPETKVVLPYTGQEFLDSLDDGREVWIYGERVGKITEHPRVPRRVGQSG